jgi:hypothetical protein
LTSLRKFHSGGDSGSALLRPAPETLKNIWSTPLEYQTKKSHPTSKVKEKKDKCPIIM